MSQVCVLAQRITIAAPTDQKLAMTFSTLPLLPVKSPRAAACCVPNTCAPNLDARRRLGGNELHRGYGRAEVTKHRGSRHHGSSGYHHSIQKADRFPE